jgi:protein SPT2
LKQVVIKRKRARESSDADSDVSRIIRKMFGYDPSKYADLDDEDDRSMEVGFRTIQMEEKRSARMAREEDARELALIKEEERLERSLARKKHQKQTLNCCL